MSDLRQGRDNGLDRGAIGFAAHNSAVPADREADACRCSYCLAASESDAFIVRDLPSFPPLPAAPGPAPAAATANAEATASADAQRPDCGTCAHTRSFGNLCWHSSSVALGRKTCAWMRRPGKACGPDRHLWQPLYDPATPPAVPRHRGPVQDESGKLDPIDALAMCEIEGASA